MLRYFEYFLPWHMRKNSEILTVEESGKQFEADAKEFVKAAVPVASVFGLACVAAFGMYALHPHIGTTALASQEKQYAGKSHYQEKEDPVKIAAPKNAGKLEIISKTF